MHSSHHVKTNIEMAKQNTSYPSIEHDKKYLSKRKSMSINVQDELFSYSTSPFNDIFHYTSHKYIPHWYLSSIPSRLNDSSIPIATRLGEEMMTFCSYTYEIIQAIQPAIDSVIEELCRIVENIWPNAIVMCFGSYTTGLWLPSSDIDVVIMGTHTEDAMQNRAVYMEELEKVAQALYHEQWVKSIDVVSSAKVPVAKLVLDGGNQDIHMDISIESVHTHHGIEASRIVTEYVTMMPIIQPIVLVLKQYLREKGLNNAFTGGLSSYTVVLMTVYLIERHGQKELELLYSKKSKNKKGNGDDKDNNQMNKYLGELLLEFFEFYGQIFDYKTTGISLKPEAFGEYPLDLSLSATTVAPVMSTLVVDDPVYHNGQHNAAAGAFAIARVISALENSYYAVTFHRPSKFTPTPLCQLIHWSGHLEINTESLMLKLFPKHAEDHEPEQEIEITKTNNNN